MHLLTILALPVISLLAGMAALFIDPKTDRKKIWILIVLLVAGAVGTIAGGFADDKAKVAQAETVNHQSSALDSQQRVLEKLSGKADDILARISTFGLSTAATSQLRQSLSADAARAAVLSSVRQQGNAGKVTIAYYPKEVDGPVVVDALRQGGFQVTTAQGNPANAAFATNAIWIGDAVTVDQAKFVALTLARAGVPIASVQRGFQKNPEAKKYLIEVGVKRGLALAKAPPLTVEQINAMTIIPSGNSDPDN